METKIKEIGNLDIEFNDEIVEVYSFENKIITLDINYLCLNAEFIETVDIRSKKTFAHFKKALRRLYADKSISYNIDKAIYNKALDGIKLINEFKKLESLKYTDLCAYDRRHLMCDKLDEFINYTLGHKGFYKGGSNWARILLSQWE